MIDPSETERVLEIAGQVLSPQEFRSLSADFVSMLQGSHSEGSRKALEAVVRTRERPALLIQGGTIDHVLASRESWSLKRHDGAIRALAASVGRIELRGEHVGTGFVVGEGLILTNRHVLEEIGKAFASPTGETWLLAAGGVTIDFDKEAGSSSRKRFVVTGVSAAGPDPIGASLSLMALDVALLTVDTRGLDASSFPPALRFADAGSEAFLEHAQIVCAGYPGRPNLPIDGEDADKERLELIAALKRMFDVLYGVKRLSPGRVLAAPGNLTPWAGPWVFTHDATTLGGASGSAVATIDGDEVRVVGLHFGGEILVRNYALAAPALFEDAFLGASRLRTIIH
jgi:serine protease